MDVEIRAEPASSLEGYARVPIAFEVRSAFDVTAGAGEFALVERPVAAPYRKDYDDNPEDHPESWPRRFDVRRWGFLGAYAGDERVGAAAVAFDTPGLEMLEGRRDLAVLWDVRVAPGRRGRGIGAALLGAAEAWARERGCVAIHVETQNVNVPACRFYARHGFRLRTAVAGAYADLPEEIQLIWRKDLTGGPAGP